VATKIEPISAGAPGAKTEDLSGVHLWLVLWKAASAVRARAEEHIAALGLGESDFAVLELLLHKGPTPVNTIGRKVLLTSGSITTAVDRLAARKLVRRAVDARDGRVRQVELTAAGRALIQPAYTDHARAMERAAAGLNREERAILLPLLRKLGRAAAGERKI